MVSLPPSLSHSRRYRYFRRVEVDEPDFTPARRVAEDASTSSINGTLAILQKVTSICNSLSTKGGNGVMESLSPNSGGVTLERMEIIASSFLRGNPNC
jgi:hypothetical protein